MDADVTRAPQTPYLALDRERLEANCARMRAIAARHGVRLRPHLKTSKSVDVAHVALGEASLRGATVSTLEEAAYFAERGLADITCAVGATPDKLERVSEIERAFGARVGVITDDVEVARAIAARGLRAWIEIDCGQRRGGVDPHGDALLEIARALGEHLAGVLTHAGHSYACSSPEEIAGVAEDERVAAVRAAERVRGAGMECPEVSVGSTPTMTHARHLAGATEMRPGVYVFGDLFQAAMGSCAREDLALSVVASVIGHKDGALWIDAGALALTQDRSVEGYGEVLTLDGREVLGRVDRLNQVHGRVATARAIALPIGARVRVHPNHACLTAAMFDRYHVEEDGALVAEWPRLRG